jgi:glutamine cyclotransferase
MSILNSLRIIPAFFVFLTFSCCVHDKTVTNAKETGSQKTAEPAHRVYSFISPSANQIIVPGKSISVKLNHEGLPEKADSIALYLDGVQLSTIIDTAPEVFVETSGKSPGIKRLKFTAFFPAGKTESSSIPLRFISDIKPKPYTYRVLGTFPHDINAYTQGFEYHDGYFYEGTGQYGESSLRKIIPGTGDIIKSRTIGSDLFGEGITVLNDKIYQITYRSQVGFIYDLENFEQLQKFYYQNREGWGLTNNGKEIIMSDGTNVIYFIDPQYFSVNRKIEVFDNVSEVDSLNELELINGIIYANRYMTNEIVMIDPVSGKLTGRADMSGLLKPEDRHPNIDVLNGIAWDEAGKRLFVTGKNWPKIYMIELIAK